MLALPQPLTPLPHHALPFACVKIINPKARKMVEIVAPPENAPVLSTPDSRILEEDLNLKIAPKAPTESEDELDSVYEIQRTVREIHEARWKRVALQFPDHMLKDAPRVARALSRGLCRHSTASKPRESSDEALLRTPEPEQKVFILADTSYGSCCVDEVAAEHADADGVVHYGRACLSPTARLPAIYCFTKASLHVDPLLAAFQNLYRDPSRKIVLMADVPYQTHLSQIQARLELVGYANVFATMVVRDAASPLPNRTMPPSVASGEESLKEWALFHLAEPSPSLLLNISSSVNSIHFYPIDSQAGSAEVVEASTSRALRRRYAMTTSLSTVPVFGILINTLSVRNYMQILQHVKNVIADAGKKSYTFVVGKVNAAKIANFGEVGGWVVIGCWESSLFESSEFWKPLITPFELELALQSDKSRVWTGTWTSDFQALLGPKLPKDEMQAASGSVAADSAKEDDESEPPEFDLRTGRYVSDSRPMGTRTLSPREASNGDSLTAHERPSSTTTLTRRPKGDLATIGGHFSPAADFFRNKRTWQGLGSDFDNADDNSPGPVEGVPVEQGRHGIARGYTIGSHNDDGTGKH